jgi:hypothetical protein
VRSTREVVILILAATACAVIFATVIGLLAIALVHPDEDVTHGLQVAWDVTALLFGAIAGYLFGKRNGNGGGH